ncbi:MAG: BamA/TamA family outer membrane protein [Prevotellaceae bacterium]|jgi:outer membrane protein assembly factor BamA|nr:BamA/TamA family outer membrane protein [Prevotellaceae bacterium]
MLGCALASCSTTKHVPQGEYLLSKGRLEIEGEGLEKEELEPLIRQQPNKTIFRNIPLYLMFYNFTADRDNFFSRWLRSAGEPPVILDTNMVAITTQHMEQYMDYRGYYGSTATATVAYGKRKAGVTYRVKLATPYHIRSIAYEITDTVIDISGIVDPNERLINVGDIFDGEVLRAESSRISNHMHTCGYYNFYDRYVTYRADTSAGDHSVDLTVLVANEPPSPGNPTGRHRRFYVKELLVALEESPRRAPVDTATAPAKWDTIRRQSFEMLCRSCVGSGRRPNLRPEVVDVNTMIKTDSLYNVRDVDRTYRNFANLRLFRSVDIRFSELPADTLLADSLPRPLRGLIALQPSMRQSYEYGGEASLSEHWLLGASLTAHHQHKNLFHGAEILDINLSGAFQKVQLEAEAAPENSYELGASVSLNTPSILFPLHFDFYSNIYSPRTQIALSGNFQRRPDYTRALADVTFGYSWRNLGGMIYIFNPVDMNIVKILQIASSFEERIGHNPYLFNSYQDAFLLGSSVSAIYSSRSESGRVRRYLRFDTELKGNLLWLGYQLFGATPGNGNEVRRAAYEVGGTQFAQFAKLDATYTYLNVFSTASAVAFRALAGVGMAYGNSLALPFDKMYYCGGANSLRGWQIRTLGPGSYSESNDLFNRLADLRLEVNAEYRFKLFWRMEGAIFADAGNIWAIRDVDAREGARFTLRDFPRQVAISWGMGLRFNFGVLVARADYGIRLHDPTNASTYFIPPKDWLAGGTNSFFIAIGYPF